MIIKRYLSVRSFVGCLVFVAGPAFAQTLTPETVRDAALPLVENGIVDGISIGFLEGDHYGSVHLGKANAAGKTADNLTVYEIGSISKVFTSLLLADAVTQGRIKLSDAAVTDNGAEIRFPDYQGRSIEWLDLSTHRSGLPRLPANLKLTSVKNPYRLYSSKQAAEALRILELPRKPGQQQEYSNFAVSVLGYLIAEESGLSYEALLKTKIAKPLGMTDCGVAFSDDQKRRFALPHDRVGSSTSAWTFADLPGAGGVHATMRDMMRFAKANLSPGDGPLSNAIELAWQKQTDADQSGPAMGLGWMIAGDGETRWHNGQTGGSHSAIFINRRLQTAVIVLCNTAVMNDIDALAARLIQMAAGMNSKPNMENGDGRKPGSDSDAEASIDETLRARLVGRYQLAPQFIFDVKDVDGHLMVGITNQPTQEVFPDSPTRWSYRSVDATLEFVLGIKGSASRLILHQNGAKQIAKRMKD